LKKKEDSIEYGTDYEHQRAKDFNKATGIQTAPQKQNKQK
jgi:hypothetical protein